MSLTQLQYERFERWRDGDFTTGKPPTKYERFEDIPLQEQPDALRFAGLEWSIGGPFLPGIEMGYVAQFGEAYDLSKPFRFEAKPGHLTRDLSLPWQADFATCETSWQVHSLCSMLCLDFS